MNRGRSVVVSFTLVSLALASGVAYAQQKFVAALRSEQEVPANPSAAIGMCTVTLNAATTEVATACTYSGLGSALVAGHIHGTAPVGVNAPILIDLSPSPGAPNGAFTAGPSAVTPTEVAALRSNLLYINLHSTNLPGGEIRGQLKKLKAVFDRDGDGRTDIGIYRYSTDTFWTQRSLNGALSTFVPSLGPGSPFDSYDQFLEGDWDGDGIADHTLRRIGPNSSLIWWIFQSRAGTVRSVSWGGGPGFNDAAAHADYDGDGLLDVAVFRQSTGVWYILQSATGTVRIVQFGAPGDISSVGDYDGDGKADLTVVRSTGGQRLWWTLRSSDGQVHVTQWGLSSDSLRFIAPVDIDGDGRQDVMIQRDVSGQWLFIIRRSSDGSAFFLPWGLTTDPTLFGDYDGDGKTDIVARRNIGGYLLWFIYQSRNGQVRYVYWGITGDQ